MGPKVGRGGKGGKGEERLLHPHSAGRVVPFLGSRGGSEGEILPLGYREGVCPQFT